MARSSEADGIVIDERLTLTIDETAAHLSISRSLVYRLIRDQGLPVVQFGGKKLVSRRALEQWIQSQQVAS